MNIIIQCEYNPECTELNISGSTAVKYSKRFYHGISSPIKWTLYIFVIPSVTHYSSIFPVTCL